MIKVYQKTEKEINKVIKNFNQKVTRLQKLGRDVIPDKISKKDLLNVNSRAELNRNLNSLRRFSKRGSEDIITFESGEKTTSWKQREVSISVRSAKAKLTRRIKNYQITKPKVFGKEQSVTFAQMGDQNYLNLVEQRKRLQDLKINTLEDLEKFNKISKKILGMGYSSVFRESYKTMLYDMAYQQNYNKEKIDFIMNNIDKLSDSSFLKLFNEDKGIKSVVYFYNTKGLLLEDISESVNIVFDEMYNNINTILEDYK